MIKCSDAVSILYKMEEKGQHEYLTNEEQTTLMLACEALRTVAEIRRLFKVDHDFEFEDPEDKLSILEDMTSHFR